MENNQGTRSLEERIREDGWGGQSVAEDYRQAIEQDPLWQKELDKFVSLIPEKFELPNATISLDQAHALDLGSGPGTITDRIVDRVNQITAIDSELNMVKNIKERYEGNSKVNVVRGSFLEIPLADNSVDLVLSNGTLWHIPIEKTGTNGEKMDAKELEDLFLSESLRVLRPGGVYILSGVWNGQNPAVAAQFDRLRAEEIKNKAARGKQPLDIRKIVISSKDLEERLKELGYECTVEMPNCPESERVGNARITLKNKIKK